MIPSWALKLIYHCLLLGFIAFTPFLIFSFDVPDFLQRRVLSHIALMTPFYFFNIYYLIPKILQKRRYKWYALAFTVNILFAVSIKQALISYFGVELFGTFPSLPSKIFIEDHNNYIAAAFPMILLMGMATGLEMIFDWERQKRDIEKAEKEKIATELMFLKSQINPHFLFNTLNSIYSLSVNQSKMSSESILILSHLMRYMLYEAKVERIELRREVEYLENYIALQKLRISTKKNVDIQLNITGTIDEQKIAPMLLISFIENSFKHGISYKHHSYICIDLKIERDTVTLDVVNSVHHNEANNVEADEFSGIGIANVNRRLNLLYPSSHELNTISESDKYRVHLELSI